VKEALASILGQKPDLVFISDTLKDGTSLSLCRKLKTDRSSSSIPLVMVLHSGKAKEREYFFEAGFNDVLVKPVERNEFFSSLRKFVNLEKRYNPRFRSRLGINCSLQYSISHDCRIYDISVGGLFLESCPPLPINTMVALNFLLPESTIRINCKGRVAWINHPIALSKIDFPFGVGVEFVEMSQTTRDTLVSYLDGIQKNGDATFSKQLRNN
jgi:CheY-like chemotaxis protein